MKLLEAGEAEMSGNSRLIIGRDLQNLIFLFPLFPSRQLFLIPKKHWEDVNLLQSIYTFFDTGTRLSILVTFAAVPAVIFFLNVKNDNKKQRFVDLTKYYSDGFAVVTQVSTKLPTTWPSRFVIGSFVIAWLVLSNTIAGKMIEFLNANLGMRNIQTVDELFKSDLIISIPAAMKMLYDQDYGEDVSDHYKFMHKTYKNSLRKFKKGDTFAFPDEFNFDQVFQTKKYAVAVSDNFAFRSLRMFYDEKGNDLITFVDSRAEIFYSNLIQRNSPFVETFNEILMKILEAGITNYQNSLAEADSNLLYIQRAKNGKLPSTDPQSISLTQLSYIFYFYLWSIGLTVFLIENFVYVL